MPKFIVRAQSTQHAEFAVEAESIDDAIEKVEDDHEDARLIYEDWGDIEATHAYPVEKKNG